MCVYVCIISSCIILHSYQTLNQLYLFIMSSSCLSAAEAMELLNSTWLKNKPIHVLFSPFHNDLSPSVIFIKNLPKSVTRKALFHVLKIYGNIISINLATDASGYATVRFDCVEAAQSAITHLNGSRLFHKSKRLHVSSFLMVEQYGFPERAYNKLNLSITSDVSKQYITDTLSPFGNVTSVCIKRLLSKDALFAAVTFEDSKAADRAAAALQPPSLPLLYIGRIHEKTSTFRPVMFLLHTFFPNTSPYTNCSVFARFYSLVRSTPKWSSANIFILTSFKLRKKMNNKTQKPHRYYSVFLFHYSHFSNVRSSHLHQSGT